MMISATITKAPYFEPTNPEVLLIETLITLPDTTQITYTAQIDGWKGLTPEQVSGVLLDTFAQLTIAYQKIAQFAAFNGQTLTNADLVDPSHLIERISHAP